jgi:hypothetical protein
LGLGEGVKQGGIYSPTQGIGGVRIEQALGRTITPGTHAGVDFVDDVLGDISLKGPLPSNGDFQGLINSAIKDVTTNTATKTTVIDTLGLSPAQISTLKTAVQAGTQGSSKTIIYLH